MYTKVPNTTSTDDVRTKSPPNNTSNQPVPNEPTVPIQYPPRRIHIEQHEAKTVKLVKSMRLGQENSNHNRGTKIVNNADDDNEIVNKCPSEQVTHLLKRKTRKNKNINKKTRRGKKKNQ